MDSDRQDAPDGVVNALCQLVEQIDERLLLKAISSRYRKGHRAIPKNLPVIKANLQIALKQARGADESLYPLLRYARTPEVSAVPVLSSRFLTCAFAELADWFGRAQFLAACWLDEREEVRGLVSGHSDEWISDPVPEKERAKARKALEEDWLCLGESEFAARDSGHASGQPTGLSDEMPLVGRIEMAVAEAKRKADAQKRKLEKKVEKLQARIEKQDAELLRRRQTADAARARAKELQEDKDALKQRFDALEAEIEGKKRLAVSEALSKKAWRWLSKPLRTEAAKEDADGRDLPAAARALLARQESQDRHYGNIREIKGKIADRLALIDELEHAQASAIRPLPELVPMIAKLQDEISRLRESVEEQPSVTNPIVRHLLARINGVASLSALSRIRSFAKEADSLALLSPEGRALVEDALNQKHERLLDPYETHISAADGHRSARDNPLFQTIETAENAVVFLDGHNVVFRMGKWFEEYFEGGQPGTRAREKLASMVLHRFAGAQAEVALYFDGSEPGVDVLSENVRVIYSGGSGANRADGAILADIKELQQRNSQANYLVVTSDMDLAGKARRKGAEVFVSETLADFLIELDEQLSPVSS